MQRSQRARWGHLIDRATAVVVAAERPTCVRLPVEVSVRGLYQPVRAVAVGAVCPGAKAVKRSQRACGGDFKNSATQGSIDSALICGSVKISIAGLDEPP